MDISAVFDESVVNCGTSVFLCFMFTQVATQIESGYEGAAGRKGQTSAGAGKFPHTVCGGSYYQEMFGTHLIQQTQNTFTTKDKIRRIWRISAVVK